jgi:hypothetical protein
MPTWFLAPIAGLKLPTQATKAAEFIPRNRFLAFINVYKYGLCNPCNANWRTLMKNTDTTTFRNLLFQVYKNDRIIW